MKNDFQVLNIFFVSGSCTPMVMSMVCSLTLLDAKAPRRFLQSQHHTAQSINREQLRIALHPSTWQWTFTALASPSLFSGPHKVCPHFTTFLNCRGCFCLRSFQILQTCLTAQLKQQGTQTFTKTKCTVHFFFYFKPGKSFYYKT